MRASEWRILWDALGESPRVLLDYDDTMSDEIARSLDQLSDVGRFDFSLSGRPSSRRNTKRRVSFSRYIEHDSAGESWHACSLAIAAAPWGQKGYLSITRRNGYAYVYLAALLTSSHEPSTDGPVPESIHEYGFRVQPVSAITLPSGLVIIGGYFNPPVGYFIPPLPPGVSIPGGSGLGVTGTPGLPSGGYTNGGSGIEPGGSGEVELVPVDPSPAVENLTPPYIVGVLPQPLQPGALVTVATEGTWKNATTIVGLWYFKGLNTDNFTKTFTIPLDAAEGDLIFYQELGSNPSGVAGAQSNFLYVAAPLPFMNINPPTITGDNESLVATPGVWQSQDDVTGVWYRNGVAMPEEISLIYSIPSDVADGDQFFYRETAVKAGRPNLTASSNFYTFGNNGDPALSVTRHVGDGALTSFSTTAPLDGATSVRLDKVMFIPDGEYPIIEVVDGQVKINAPNVEFTGNVIAVGNTSLTHEPGTPFETLAVLIDFDYNFTIISNDGADYQVVDVMGNLGTSGTSKILSMFEAPGGIYGTHPILPGVAIFNLTRNGVVCSQIFMTVNIEGTVTVSPGGSTSPLPPNIPSSYSMVVNLYGESEHQPSFPFSEDEPFADATINHLLPSGKVEIIP